MRFNKFFLSMVLLTLVACHMMPGMQNPDTASMRKSPTTYFTPQPTLIPITPAIIAQTDVTQYVYQVAPADILDITVWRHPEFLIQENAFHTHPDTPSSQGAAGQSGFLVNSKGDIYYPLIGKLHVSGKSVDQVRSLLTMRLRKYIKNPQVLVRVGDFRGQKIYIFGEVMKPGFFALNDQPLSITGALMLAGGIDPNAADPEHIYVIRGRFDYPNIYWLNAKTPENLLLAEHFHLRPSDILYVSSASATRWNRVLNQLLPTIQTVWYTKAIVDSHS